MSESDNFLSRWSRRKRVAEEPEKPAAAGAPPPARAGDAKPPPAAPPSSPTTATAGASEQAFDPASLPSIDSITAETDIRCFLAPGVPPELTRAALRRAWTVDPKIRDFIGLSENAWDFNAPNAMPGFEPLEMTDELRRQ